MVEIISLFIASPFSISSSRCGVIVILSLDSEDASAGRFEYHIVITLPILGVQGALRLLTRAYHRVERLLYA